MPLLISVCSSASVWMPLPLLADAATAASAAGRLVSVKPSTPMASRSVRVKGGVGVPPAAVLSRRLTTLASWSSSSMVFTPLTDSRDTRSLSRLRPGALVAMPPSATPMRW